MRRQVVLGAFIAVAMVASACADQAGPTPNGLSIVVTTNILGDVVANVAGDDADIEVLMTLGVDPHEFQASSAQVARINTADLVVANGLALEEGLIDVLAGAVADGARVLEIAPLLDPIPFVGGHDHDHGDEDDADHDHDDDDHADESHGDDDDADHGDEGELDPHVWMDPLRMAHAARLIATELAAIEPSIDWMARAEAYAAELTELDGEIQAMLAAVPEESRRLVTNHATFGYFADRYGWEVLRTVIPGGSSVGAPSSADLAELVALIEEEGVRAIFVETTRPDALARAVATEVGAEVTVVELHTESLSPRGTEADTLIGLLRTNAHLIAGALTAGG